MPRNRDDPPAVRVYTVCDESKYLTVRNVPALGCGDELLKLFGSYGEVEECKPMDAEDCEPFTDVYWINFRRVDNARFAKRKLDEYSLLGNRLQVSYAPEFESLSDTKEKLEGRRTEVLARLNPKRSKGPTVHKASVLGNTLSAGSTSVSSCASQTMSSDGRCLTEFSSSSQYQDLSVIDRVSSDKDYFSSPSMNQTVQFVRDKLNKIQARAEDLPAGPLKKTRVDNRRRI